MKSRLLSCIIFIFLSGAVSVRAQSLALKAVEYERVIFEGAAPAAANEAMLSRAGCLVQLGRWADADACLSRLRMYALGPEQREESAYLRTLCQYRLKNYDAALAVMGEAEFPSAPEAMKLKALVLAGAREFDKALEQAVPLVSDRNALDALFSGRPKEKSALKALFLGIIPTAGHVYLERPDLWWTTVGTVASAGFAVYEAVSGNWLTAILGGGMLLNTIYVDNNLRPIESTVMKYNSESLEKFLQELETILDF